MNGKGIELEHVHLLKRKVGDGRAQFNIDRMLENQIP